VGKPLEGTLSHTLAEMSHDKLL